MSELEQAILDAKADLDMAESVRRTRSEELQIARERSEEAIDKFSKAQKNYLTLLQAKAKEPKE